MCLSARGDGSAAVMTGVTRVMSASVTVQDQQMNLNWPRLGKLWLPTLGKCLGHILGGVSPTTNWGGDDFLNNANISCIHAKHAVCVCVYFISPGLFDR